MSDVTGQTYSRFLAPVSREEIVRFAKAIGTTDRRCLHVEAARSAGYKDVIAPLTFAAKLIADTQFLALNDSDLGVDYRWLLHRTEEIRRYEPIIAGDHLVAHTTTDAIRRSARGVVVSLDSRLERIGRNVLIVYGEFFIRTGDQKELR